jgi:hypothetical protein
LQRIIKSEDLSPSYKSNAKLTDKELELILEIRTGSYKSITVKMKNGELINMEKEKKENVQKKLREIAMENKYEEVCIQLKHGQILNITRFIKENY